MPVKFLDALLFMSMGLTIAISTKTIGALPVFAYTVLPPAAALCLTQNIKTIFILAPTLGAATAFFGYYLSFIWELPTGACTTGLGVAAFGVPMTVAAIVRAGKRGRKN